MSHTRRSAGSVSVLFSFVVGVAAMCRWLQGIQVSIRNGDRQDRSTGTCEKQSG